MLEDRPSMGWTRERLKEAWHGRTSDRVRVDTLRRGTIFTSIDGDCWRYVRKDGALSHVESIEALNGREQTTFAGNTEVLILRPVE